MDKFFKIDNLNLSYRLDFPANNNIKQVPLLIMIHGWNSNKDRKSYTSVSKMALNRGYGVLSMDLRGHGTSGGDMETCNLNNLSTDIVSLINHVLDVNINLDRENIMIFGGSVGGEIAIKILLDNQIAIKKLILSSPGLGKKLTKTKNNISRDLYYDKIADFTGRSYKEFIYKFKENNCDIIIIHGDSDNTVPISQSQELVKLNLKHVKLDIIIGMDHKPKGEEEFLERLRAIEKYL